ncbi:MAG: polysaccharide deacetylase family protein, partial [Candidatus Electryoneaceae bacterium]|nr:polysaccharide deacetylase family protein [Candidatus Electryoneaceae bacterium]
PNLVNYIADKGHTVASHGYHHRSLMFASRRNVLEDMIRANEIIKYDKNGITPVLFRPPYGRIGIGVWQAARQLGMKIVLWSLSPADYRIQPTDSIVQHVIDRVRPGDIILLHERRRTIEAIKPMIDGLRDKGLEPKAL